MKLIIEIIVMALSFYVWLIIAHIILSWLFVFNVVNSRNQFVSMIGEFLYRVTEPALRPIRRFMPDLGGIDLSPIVLFFAIYFVQQFLMRYIWPYVP